MHGRFWGSATGSNKKTLTRRLAASRWLRLSELNSPQPMELAPPIGAKRFASIGDRVMRLA
ncbi:MAG: hypothetical protein ABI548_26345 [Polyangiaceae bacterium]